MATSLRIQSEFTNDRVTNAVKLQSRGAVAWVIERTDSSDVDAGNSAKNWPRLVKRIQDGDETGMKEFYQLLERGFRSYLCSRLGRQDVDDKIHDAFLIVVKAILRGDLREPDRLMGFVKTVVRRQLLAHIELRVRSRDHTHLDVAARVSDQRLDPEQNIAFHDRVGLMLETLGQLSGRDNEILTRYYLHEETQGHICAEMHLTEIQFRLFKSRAKARFGELGKRKLRRNILGPTLSKGTTRIKLPSRKVSHTMSAA
jgi:RNA polymerase sigma-70 factor (ECF subfamily)